MSCLPMPWRQLPVPGVSLRPPWEVGAFSTTTGATLPPQAHCWVLATKDVRAQAAFFGLVRQ